MKKRIKQILPILCSIIIFSFTTLAADFPYKINYQGQTLKVSKATYEIYKEYTGYVKQLEDWSLPALKRIDILKKRDDSQKRLEQSLDKDNEDALHSAISNVGQTYNADGTSQNPPKEKTQWSSGYTEQDAAEVQYFGSSTNSKVHMYPGKHLPAGYAGPVYSSQYSNSSLLTGWPQNSSGTFDYYYENGYLQRNKWIDGKFYVGNDGKKLKNTFTPDGYYVDSQGIWDGKPSKYQQNSSSSSSNNSSNSSSYSSSTGFTGWKQEGSGFRHYTNGVPTANMPVDANGWATDANGWGYQPGSTNVNSGTTSNNSSGNSYNYQSSSSNNSVNYGGESINDLIDGNGRFTGEAFTSMGSVNVNGWSMASKPMDMYDISNDQWVSSGTYWFINKNIKNYTQGVWAEWASGRWYFATSTEEVYYETDDGDTKKESGKYNIVDYLQDQYALIDNKVYYFDDDGICINKQPAFNETFSNGKMNGFRPENNDDSDSTPVINNVVPAPNNNNNNTNNTNNNNVSNNTNNTNNNTSNSIAAPPVINYQPSNSTSGNEATKEQLKAMLYDILNSVENKQATSATKQEIKDKLNQAKGLANTLR